MNEMSCVSNFVENKKFNMVNNVNQSEDVTMVFLWIKFNMNFLIFFINFFGPTHDLNGILMAMG